MSHLGTTIIPRTRISAIRNSDRGGAYLSRVNREHEEIYAAIARRDPESARAAMRIHLTNSRERLRVAQEQAQQAGASAPTPRRPEFLLAGWTRCTFSCTMTDK